MLHMPALQDRDPGKWPGDRVMLIINSTKANGSARFCGAWGTNSCCCPFLDLGRDHSHYPSCLWSMNTTRTPPEEVHRPL